MLINEWPSKCLGFIANKVIFIYRVGENIKIVQMDLTVTHHRNPVSWSNYQGESSVSGLPDF